MSGLERQLTEALKRLSAQYETEQRHQSEQVEGLRQQVEALRRHVERQTEENGALQMRIERLDGQVTRLAECYGTLAATFRLR